MIHKVRGSVAAGDRNILTEQLPMTLAGNVLAALSNFVTGGASPEGAQGAPYSNGLQAPPITVKASGIFLVWAHLSIFPGEGGTLANNDGVFYQLLRNATPIGSVPTTTAQTSSVGGVVALCPIHMLDVSGLAHGTVITYSLQISSTNAHTSAVNAAGDGQISVIEIPHP